MRKAKFSLMGKSFNPDIIDGKFSAFAKVPYSIQVRLSKELAKDGYGTVTVDGIEISKGEMFYLDLVIKAHCLLIPVGEVAREYNKEYTVAFHGFTAKDGTPFQDQSFRIKTTARGEKDEKHKAHDKVALQAAREGMVLLKNENRTLPLKENEILNCFGAGQYMFRNTSTGASLINPRWQANFHQSIKEYLWIS